MQKNWEKAKKLLFFKTLTLFFPIFFSPVLQKRKTNKKRRAHLLHRNDNTWDTWQWMSVLWDTIRHYQGVGRRMSSVATPRMPYGGALATSFGRRRKRWTQFFCTQQEEWWFECGLSNEFERGKRSCVICCFNFVDMFNFGWVYPLLGKILLACLVSGWGVCGKKRFSL